jgi:asparagine synthase (glutamine-hydrolysing)
MCGIVSIFSYNSGKSSVDREELRRIRDYMTPRGPDGYGEWYSSDNLVGLGHRRLSIIDLSESGAQPMQNRDGSLVITYNGEIYNYQTLRESLEKKGYHFRSSSDTEVLLHLYAEKGFNMLHDLRGMFAFAIWDHKRKGLFLARDPFGIKPLYYADNGKTFFAASQVKALMKSKHIDTSPEPAGHVGFFLWGHIPEPYTLFRGIRSLPAGSYMTVDQNGNKTTMKYCSITQIFADAERDPFSLSKEEVHERLRSALLETVQHHLIADVPVGIFLSSGLDSVTLTALASEIAKDRLNTVTLGFREYLGTDNDEVPFAEQVAKDYGTRQRTILVGKKDFETELEHLFDAMDQPTIDGVNSYFVSKAATQAGLKVALSGVGGDELFGSYPSFRQIPRMVGAFGPINALLSMGKAFRAVSAPLLKHFTSPKYAGLFEYGGSYGGAYLLRRGMFMPWELPKLLDGGMVREGWQELQTLTKLEQTIGSIDNSYLKVAALEISWYMRNQLLRDTDWASMAHSVEVRLPLVDVSLLHVLCPLLSTFNGVSGKRNMALTPVKRLPDIILNRAKTGFTVPVNEWIKEDDTSVQGRKLRGWAIKIYEKAGQSDVAPAKQKHYKKTSSPALIESHRQSSLKILALLTDAFGGLGGIALYNQDLLKALCENPGCKEVVAIPRLMPFGTEALPEKLIYLTDGLDSKFKYVKTALRVIREKKPFDLIICGHINLLPLAYMAKLMLGAPLILEIYGIDAWKPTKSRLANYLLKHIDAFISISDFTRNKFLAWADLASTKGFLLPNAIDILSYGPGPKNPALVDRYGLHNKTVLMTLGRLVSRERYKGFDEVIDILPDLVKEVPNIVYIIAGDGDDRSRLEEKARSLGLTARIFFTGWIPEAEKADHYRLADAYVMPSRGEGFGFVFLEAMACGIPVVASQSDGSREAVRNGNLGLLVDPADQGELKKAVLEAINRPKGNIPDGLSYFSFANFSDRLSGIINQII